MAANDYYNPDRLRRPAEAPLPPLPSPYSAYNTNQKSNSSVSPTASAVDDPYLPQPHRSQQSFGYDNAYYGASVRDNDPTPYSDDIPLRPHPKQTSSETYGGNNEVRYNPEGTYPPSDPAIVNRARRPKQTWRERLFSGKVPWVVYGFTVIQIAVFIGELAKNGILNVVLQSLKS